MKQQNHRHNLQESLQQAVQPGEAPGCSHQPSAPPEPDQFLQESLELEQSRRRTLERQLADISHVSPRSPRVTDPRMQALDQQVGG